MSLTLRYAVRSDRGLVRGNNEDSVYAGPRLLAIADGMGGHAAGEVASKIVISTLERLDEDRPVGDLLSALRQAVEQANGSIADEVAGNSELDGMGTTLTALRFSGAQVGLAHVGDSRAYLMRNGSLSQITHDDTYVQSLVDMGRLTADEAANHPRKSVILRALTGVPVDPDVSIRESRPGDRYLLCTDGLTDVVSAQTLFETLPEGDPQECADRLVELALRGGGPDNVTCIVADVVDEDFGDDLPVIAGAFVDPATGESARTDSPAERAALINRPPSASVAAPRRPNRRRFRTLLLVAVLVIVAVGAGISTYAWTQTQYFVARDGDQVAIFRGVDTAFGPLKFFSVQKHTGPAVDDLQPAVRSQVESGITASSEQDAEAIVERLRGQQLPLCSSLLLPPSSAPAHSSAPPSGLRTATAAPRTTPTPITTAHATATPSASVRLTPPTVRATHTPVPGVDCRSS